MKNDIPLPYPDEHVDVEAIFSTPGLEKISYLKYAALTSAKSSHCKKKNDRNFFGVMFQACNFLGAFFRTTRRFMCLGSGDNCEVAAVSAGRRLLCDELERPRRRCSTCPSAHK